jgi:hypothetical protein
MDFNFIVGNGISGEVVRRSAGIRSLMDNWDLDVRCRTRAGKVLDGKCLVLRRDGCLAATFVIAWPRGRELETPELSLSLPVTAGGTGEEGCPPSAEDFSMTGHSSHSVTLGGDLEAGGRTKRCGSQVVFLLGRAGCCDGGVESIVDL